MYTEVQLQCETSRNVLTPLVMSSSDLCGFRFVKYSVKFGDLLGRVQLIDFVIFCGMHHIFQVSP